MSEFPCQECGSKKRFHKKGCSMVDSAKVNNTTTISKEMQKCGNCYYYIPVHGGMSECRRFPPYTGNRFAWVAPDQWCGEWGHNN